jgi:pyrimidine deaminase RibD-like protein
MVEPRGLDQHIVHEDVVSSECESSHGSPHAGGQALADLAGNDAHTRRGTVVVLRLDPAEAVGRTWPGLHPTLVDRAPERVDPDPQPRIVRLALEGASDRCLARAARAIEQDDPSRQHRQLMPAGEQDLSA